MTAETETPRVPYYATCRGCDCAFRPTGHYAQDPQHPRLCRDCSSREQGHHPYHSLGVECLEGLL